MCATKNFRIAKETVCSKVRARCLIETCSAPCEDNQLKQKLIKLIENLHLNKAYLQAYFTLEFQSNIREQSLSPSALLERSPLALKVCVCFSKRERATAERRDPERLKTSDELAKKSRLVWKSNINVNGELFAQRRIHSRQTTEHLSRPY